MHSLTEQVTFEWGSEDLLRQKWEDLKKEHHKQRCDSMRSCSEKGPLSRVPAMRCGRRDWRGLRLTRKVGTTSGPRSESLRNSEPLVLSEQGCGEEGCV